jgi:hypothetical protein
MKNIIRVLALATATILPAAAFAQGGDKAPAAKPADDKAAPAGAAAPAAPAADAKPADDKGKKHAKKPKADKAAPAPAAPAPAK